MTAVPGVAALVAKQPWAGWSVRLVADDEQALAIATRNLLLQMADRVPRAGASVADCGTAACPSCVRLHVFSAADAEAQAALVQWMYDALAHLVGHVGSP